MESMSTKSSATSQKLAAFEAQAIEVAAILSALANEQRLMILCTRRGDRAQPIRAVPAPRQDA
jgi:hypothetical protein